MLAATGGQMLYQCMTVRQTNTAVDKDWLRHQRCLSASTSGANLMQLRSLLLGATLLSAPGLAMAQLPELAPPPPLSGLYVGAGAGANWMLEQHLINPFTQTAANGNLVSQTGFVALGSVGYAIPYTGLRFELEGDYRSNKWNHASGLGFPGGAGGYEVKYAVMVNALYDFSALIPVPWFAPYAGVGVDRC
jgi:OmpA-OmpF porin, OOP family